MSSNAHLNINDKFARTDTSVAKGHPLRGTIKREHLLRRPDNNPERARIAMIRDTVISIMGGISALIPIFIAIQTVTGA
jgi:hypothetical protein